MWTLPRPVLPCPFCGGTDVLALSLGGSAGVLQCRTCNAQGPPAITHDLAMRAWETRGALLLRTCRWCATPYQPHALRQQYCDTPCRRAAAAQLRAERQRGWEQEHRRAAQQHKAAQQREARKQDRLQRQWLLASS